MTNHQQKLGFWHQLRWYYSNYKKASRTGDYRIYLFRDTGGRAVGYGALQRHDGNFYITECLDTTARGQGYGRQILNTLIKTVRDEDYNLVAEIWADNLASCALHEKAGFVLIAQREYKGRKVFVYQLGINS